MIGKPIVIYYLVNHDPMGWLGVSAIKHVETVQVNRDLNIKYGSADPLVQADFNEKGLLPDDYIKVPNDVAGHVPRI